jgi:hypothetical protein
MIRNLGMLAPLQRDCGSKIADLAGRQTVGRRSGEIAGSGLAQKAGDHELQGVRLPDERAIRPYSGVT